MTSYLLARLPGNLGHSATGFGWHHCASRSRHALVSLDTSRFFTAPQLQAWIEWRPSICFPPLNGVGRTRSSLDHGGVGGRTARGGSREAPSRVRRFFMRSRRRTKAWDSHSCVDLGLTSPVQPSAFPQRVRSPAFATAANANNAYSRTLTEPPERSASQAMCTQEHANCRPRRPEIPPVLTLSCFRVPPT